jgi:DNA polymerase-3 subunit alpha
VAQRYGRDRVAQILTFTKYKLRSAVNGICKALEKKDKSGKVVAYGYKVADEIGAVLEIAGDQGKMPDQSDCTYQKMMEIAERPEKYEEYGSELPKFIEASKEFRRLMLKYPELNERLAKIEGCIQTSGIHAGGVIISRRPLALDCPTIMPREDSKAVLPITMWDYPDCEEVGLLKMDLLRTSTLRIISLTLELIRSSTGEEVDLYEIGRDDPETFKFIAEGNTHGLFQINGGGITKYTMQVKPKTQDEIIDILALYRPGPLDAVLENGNTIAQQYVINGSRKPQEYMKEVRPEIREFLRKSRGQMIYQEQVMSIVQRVAGYNLGHADSFRRVIGKKKIADVKKLYDEFMYGHKYVVKKWEKLLAEYDSLPKFKDKDGNEVIRVKSKYDGNDIELTKPEIQAELEATKKAMAAHVIPGALKMGYDKKFARNLFKQMVKFAGYAFNKPHSGCYADETFQTAYLKCHYPVQFMTALLSVRGDKADKTLDNLKEAKRLGIKILPPDVNRSFSEFAPEKDGIRYGLLSIAGIGQATVNQIVNEREKNGPYQSFDDFVQRHTFKGSQVKRNHYQTLISAGCFDRFEKNRYKLLNYYNFTIRKDKVWTGTPETLEKDKAKATHSVKWNEKEFNDKKALEMERELIGVYVSGSPYEDLPFTPLQDMKLSRRRDKVFYDIGGRIISAKIIKTKKGKPMAFLTLETQLEPIEVTVFPDVYDEYAQHLYKDNIVVVRGYKEETYYKGERQEKFIASKILVQKTKKLKRELGINDEPKPQTQEEPELPVVEQMKPKKRKDPMAELMEDKLKGKKKRKDDLSKYFEDDDEEEEAL